MNEVGVVVGLRLVVREELSGREAQGGIGFVALQQRLNESLKVLTHHFTSLLNWRATLSTNRRLRQESKDALDGVD